MRLNLSHSKDLKNTSSTSSVGNSLGEEDRNSLTSSTSSVDDPSQLHLPVNQKNTQTTRDKEGH